MPAEVLRERETLPETQVPSASPATSAPAFPDLAAEITQNRALIERARQELERTVAAEGAARERYATEMKPPIAEARQALQPSPVAAAARADVQKAREAYEKQGPPPSRKLTDFLAPVQGEAPENTIAKLIQGVSLMASGFTGLARGDAKAALAGLHGALKGWHEGDKERADRAFKDWEAASGKLLKDWEIRHKTYRDIMEDGNQQIADRLKLVELKALESGHDLAVKTFERQSAAEGLQFLQEDRNAMFRFMGLRERLLEMAHQKNLDREYKLAIAELTASKKEEHRQEILANYEPGSPALTALAWKTIHDGGRVPNIGMAGPIGQDVRGRVLKEVGRLMGEHNIPLSSLPAIGDEMKGWQTNINTAARNLAYWNANIGTFHKHMDQFLKLSESTERGQSPVVNRFALKLRGQYAGDSEVARYEAMAFEVAQEYAKLSVGTAQGDANSRDAARKAIDPAMNPKQLRDIMAELVTAGENRKKSWEEAMKQGADMVHTFGGRLSAPLPPAGRETQPADFVWNETTGKLERRK